MELRADKDIRRKCQELYGRDFCGRTWSEWRKLTGIERHSRWLTLEQCANLFALAMLKREQPFARIRLLDVIRERKSRDWTQWLTTMADLPRGSLLQPCYGRDLSATLEGLTGRKIAEPTLYQWGREPGMIPFKRNHQYTATQVSIWVRRTKQENRRNKNDNPRNCSAA